MTMRFLNQLSYIRRLYDKVEYAINHPAWYKELLTEWDIDPTDENQIASIRREHAAIRYLIAFELNTTYGETAVKPDIADLIAVFERLLSLAANIYHVTADNWQDADIDGRLFYEACQHYLDKLNKPKWFQQLPDRIRQ